MDALTLFEKLASLSVAKQQQLYQMAKDAHEASRAEITEPEYRKRVTDTLNSLVDDAVDRQNARRAP